MLWERFTWILLIDLLVDRCVPSCLGVLFFVFKRYTVYFLLLRVVLTRAKSSVGSAGLRGLVNIVLR